MPKYDLNYHEFSKIILDILKRHYGEYAQDIFELSPLLGYLNNKTKAANRGSKARGAFANHYALYVIVEDYIQKGFYDNKTEIPYSKYEGARFSDLFKRQRELPFGARLQNHALNSRLNDEFKKFYPAVGKPPIVRDVEKQRYWIQEDLLQIQVRHTDGSDHLYNIAPAIIEIINAYISTKMAAFESFLNACQRLIELGNQDPNQAIEFVREQLMPNVDARIFEIVSFAVLKARYGQETIWIGESRDSVIEETLILYKTGRTNANDGGIDFVMRPLGRFFQVTETVDAGKFFLDIDKVQRFPITFVIKSTGEEEQIRGVIKAQAEAKYRIEAIVNAYMEAIEEIINVNDLINYFNEIVDSGRLTEVMDEIMIQSKVEFNYNDEE